MSKSASTEQAQQRLTFNGERKTHDVQNNFPDVEAFV